MSDDAFGFGVAVLVAMLLGFCMGRCDIGLSTGVNVGPVPHARDGGQ